MSRPDHLLPANATPIERDLAALSAGLDRIDPSVITGIWDAWRCPASLLPWLAWALSVDQWDDAWSEIVRRQAIADSPAYHRLKGSRASVEAAMALMRCPTLLVEWHETLPEGRRGTARAFADITIHGGPSVARDQLARLKRLVQAAKPKSRAVWCGVGEASLGSASIGVGMLTSRVITIQPYAIAQPPVSGAVNAGIGIFIQRSITIGA